MGSRMAPRRAASTIAKHVMMTAGIHIKFLKALPAPMVSCGKCTETTVFSIIFTLVLSYHYPINYK